VKGLSIGIGILYNQVCAHKVMFKDEKRKGNSEIEGIDSEIL